MKLSATRAGELAKDRGMTLSGVLRRAGVSRTAFYSLARRPSALPRSVHALANALGVPPSCLLAEEVPRMEARAKALLAEARRIQARHRNASFENVWHALWLLEVPPLERLNRSLIRGHTAPVHR